MTCFAMLYISQLLLFLLFLHISCVQYFHVVTCGILYYIMLRNVINVMWRLMICYSMIIKFCYVLKFLLFLCFSCL